MGRDILSSSPAMVAFLDRSFITDEGMYNATDRVFTDFNGKEKECANLGEYKTEVNNMFLASAGILDNDYYGIVFGTRKTRLK
jgi:hypothetical protein